VKELSRKKVVFIIVEGKSDEIALGLIFDQWFQRQNVFIQITHGDITSDRNTTPQNITAKVGDLVKEYAASAYLRKNDFQEVIHILDTDGTFIPDQYVQENPEQDHTWYTPHSIVTGSRGSIILRNQKKSACMNRLSALTTVWKSVPYHAYYMSSNLDHVLYDLQNSTDVEKEKHSMQFAKKYSHDLGGFIQFISASDFSVCRTYTYQSSWDFIKEDLHSLERHTNLGLCFKE
jgi:hypothetical protein